MLSGEYFFCLSSLTRTYARAENEIPTERLPGVSSRGLDWENKMNKLTQGYMGFSAKNTYEIPAYLLREVYYTRRMQRVFCACFSADSTFVFSGSEETNIRYDI